MKPETEIGIQNLKETYVNDCEGMEKYIKNRKRDLFEFLYDKFHHFSTDAFDRHTSLIPDKKNSKNIAIKLITFKVNRNNKLRNLPLYVTLYIGLLNYGTIIILIHPNMKVAIRYGDKRAKFIYTVVFKWPRNQCSFGLQKYTHEVTCITKILT